MKNEYYITQHYATQLLPHAQQNTVSVRAGQLGFLFKVNLVNREGQ